MLRIATCKERSLFKFVDNVNIGYGRQTVQLTKLGLFI